MRSLGISFIVFLILSQANALACEYSTDAVLRYEKEILRAESPAKVAEPLMCILEIQEKGEGMAKYLAASTLRPLMGGPQIAGVLKDARYKNVESLITRLTLRSNDVLRESVVAAFAAGDWEFYKMFCEQGDTSGCKDFMPDEKFVKGERPLLAAASMVRLKKAFHALKGKDQEIVAQRIKNLYRDIPESQALQRKFIDQIYNELFGMKLG
jgi:hypothetical protein